ncbi:MAG TPA: putative Ig domain-containing protein, partial [Terriglobales bacterium]|nr:putative Ig domain-containing protein [Terriglobales bacterium]
MLTGCGGGGGGSSTSTPPPQSLTIITDTSVRCVESTPFSLTLQDAAASGAVTWSVISGQLPSGLSLNAMSGVISGTPTASTISNATIQAADAKTSTSKSFVFLVWQKLAVNPVSVPAAHLNAPYSLQMTATASGAIASWTVTGGELPPGLTLNSGAIAGTPS